MAQGSTQAPASQTCVPGQRTPAHASTQAPLMHTWPGAQSQSGTQRSPSAVALQVEPGGHDALPPLPLHAVKQAL